MDCNEQDQLARAMFDQLNPFELTPELWKALQDYTNEISARHGTCWMNMDVKVMDSNKIPNANKIAVLTFGMKKADDPNEQHKIEYAILPLDDTGHAFGFLPVEGE